MTTFNQNFNDLVKATFSEQKANDENIQDMGTSQQKAKISFKIITVSEKNI